MKLKVKIKRIIILEQLKNWNETRIKTESLELLPQDMAFFDTTHSYASDRENIASWKTMEKLGMKRISCTGGRFNKIAPTEERKEFLYEL